MYDGNKVPMAVDEGAWTADSTRTLGGYFATPAQEGMFVSLVSTKSFAVAKCTSGNPIGKLVGGPIGAVSLGQFGRQWTVQLFGDYVSEVELDTASDAIAIGGSLQFSKNGGKEGNGVFKNDTANSIISLEASAATGSIASGSKLYVLFGAHSF